MNAGSRPTNVLLHFTQRSIGLGRKRRAARSRTNSGSSSETTFAGRRTSAPFGAAPLVGVTFAPPCAAAERAFRRRPTARLGFRFSPGRFMADALYINGPEEEP